MIPSSISTNLNAKLNITHRNCPRDGYVAIFVAQKPERLHPSRICLECNACKTLIDIYVEVGLQQETK